MKQFIGEDAVHWEYSSATPGTDAVTVTIYNPDGTSRTLSSSEEGWITSYSLGVGDIGMRADLFIDCDADGAVDAGERLCGKTYAANSGEGMDISNNPRKVTSTDILKVKCASSAQVDVVCHGFVRRI